MNPRYPAMATSGIFIYIVIPQFHDAKMRNHVRYGLISTLIHCPNYDVKTIKLDNYEILIGL